MLIALPPALLLLTLGGPPDDQGRFVRYQPLTLADLYAKRMRFMRGEPMVSVGLMDGQDSVTVTADAPLRLLFEEGDMPKASYAPEGTRFTMKRISAEPGSIRHWVVVFAARIGDRALADVEAERWSKAGHPVKLFEAGTIIAVRGNVLDTRQWQVAVGGFETQQSAAQRMRELAQEGHQRLFLHEELVRPPRGVIGIYNEKGTLLHRAWDSVYVGTTDVGKLKVSQVEFARGYKNHGREDRSYFGHLYVVLDRNGKLAAVNSVGAEQLLAGLVPAEIFPTAPIEALKAQAVTARGEIFSKLAQRHHGEPFHLCSEQHCQVYAGAGQEHPASTRAVNETRGLLAFRPRTKTVEPLELVDSVYSSSCGGYSEANEVVWGTPPSPSLRPRLDAATKDPALARYERGLGEGANLRSFLESYPPTECSRASFAQKDRFRWKRTYAAADLEALVAPLGVGRPKTVEILGRGPGGRIAGVRVEGSAGKAEVLQELPVRRLFGNLLSGLFVLDVAREKDGSLASITFTGGGWGHGVGMCQMGAIGRAERGQGFKQILSHYYSGAVTEEIY